MKARHTDPKVTNSAKPFEHCKLGRGTQAELLADVVAKYKEGFVLAINNKWGHGKTTFVKMWRVYLGNPDPRGIRKGTFRTLYFNAWENDLDNSVFIALLSELKKELKPYQSGTQFNTVLEKAQPFLKSVIPGVAKALATHWVGKEAVDTLVEGTAEGLANALDKELDAYQEKKNSLKTFRDALEDYVKGVSDEEEFEEEGGDGIGKNPVVFIIDELDRCRPDYAVTVLEHIKHLFSVPGIVFVLSIDKEQLGHAVRGVYGSAEMDANEYLRRFIDLEYSLPEPSYKQFVDYLIGYFQFEEIGYEPAKEKEQISFNLEDFSEFASKLLEVSEATLRQQEKLFARLKAIQSILKKREEQYLLVFFYLLYIKEYQLDHFKEIRSFSPNYNKVLKDAQTIMNPCLGNGAYMFYPKFVAQFISSYTGIELIRFMQNGRVHINANYTFHSESEKEMYSNALRFHKAHPNNRIAVRQLLKRVELTEKLTKL
jgi:hypothetical protein